MKTSQIEEEKWEELLSTIGDLLEWLQSLKQNPELMHENSPMIENEIEEVLQIFHNFITEDLKE
ncbi:hypothetical protein DSECCO2_48890 [anaerobic digester metagenome]